MDALNALHIQDFWQVIISVFTSVSLIYLVEWLKQPSIQIEKDNDLILPDGRKMLKVKVIIIKKGWYRKIFPWQNMAANARLKGSLISKKSGKEIELQSYVIKWDTRPEPWDYEKNKPKLELLPATSEPENFLSGDNCTAAVVVKHPGKTCFYIYDGNYYINPSTNERDEKEIILRLKFTSSAVTQEKDFVVINGNATISAFSLKEE